MSYELISEEEYDALPFDDPDRCFVEIESIVRRNMTRMIDQNSSGDFEQAVREQYMAIVSAVAAECNIPNIHFDVSSRDNFWPESNAFSLAVQGEVARIRIRVLGRQRPYSVLLTTNTRTTIEHYISRIRETVQGSELDPSRKKRIDEKLDQLAAELMCLSARPRACASACPMTETANDAPSEPPASHWPAKNPLGVQAPRKRALQKIMNQFHPIDRLAHARLPARFATSSCAEIKNSGVFESFKMRGFVREIYHAER